jgi:hypothetical protein
MPRYAVGSLEKAIYLDLKKESAEENPKAHVRRNGRISRAHRLDEFMAPDAATCAERIGAIRNTLAMLQREWCSPETAVTLIHNITKGE